MPVPVTVVTGAPGSGKSTLVNRLLDGAPEGVVVVESEWGDVAVEHDRVVATVPDELPRALARLARRRIPPAHVIVEIADAEAARAALSDEDVRDAFELADVLRGGDPAPAGPAAARPRAVPPAPAVPPALTPEVLEPVADVALPDWAAALAWHPNGELLAVACADGSVHELLADGSADAAVGFHEGGAAAVGYAPDGTLATGGADGRVGIGTQPPVLAGAGWVEPLAWSPGATAEDALLATAVGQRVQLWSAGGALVAEADPLGAPVDALRWTPDGGRLACSGPGGVALLGRDGAPAGDRVAADGRASTVAFTPDCRRLACAMRAREVQLWDLDTRRARALGGFARGVAALDWSADGRWLAAAGGAEVRAWHGDGLEPDQGLRLGAHAGVVRWVGFQPRGPFLASAGDDGFVVLWYLPAQRPIAALALGAPVGAAAWAPDGGRIAVGTGSGRVLVLALAAG